MAIFGALFAALGRVVGRVANMALGWASILLFGRIPKEKQAILTAVTLGSIAWVAALLGVLVPTVGTILLAAVPKPGFVPDTWVRLAMLAVAIVLPLLIGAATIFLLDPKARPKGAGLVVQVLRGYPYAAVLAITLIWLGIVAIVRKVRSLAKRWEDAHVPLVVKPGAYDRVADALEQALDAAGLDVRREAAPRALEVPARLLGLVGGAGVRSLIPDRLVQLKADDLDVLLHPSDVAIMGSKERVARSRAALATRLTHAEAYLTTSPDAEKIEDRIADLSRKPNLVPADFRSLDEDLAKVTISADDWETLYRERLQVENERLIPGSSRPGLGTAKPDVVGAPSAATTRAPNGRDPSEPTPVGWAAAIASIGLLAADVALAIADRVRGDRGRTSRAG